MAGPSLSPIEPESRCHVNGRPRAEPELADRTSGRESPDPLARAESAMDCAGLRVAAIIRLNLKWHGLYLRVTSFDPVAMSGAAAGVPVRVSVSLLPRPGQRCYAVSARGAARQTRPLVFQVFPEPEKPGPGLGGSGIRVLLSKKSRVVSVSQASVMLRMVRCSSLCHQWFLPSQKSRRPRPGPPGPPPAITVGGRGTTRNVSDVHIVQDRYFRRASD